MCAVLGSPPEHELKNQKLHPRIEARRMILLLYPRKNRLGYCETLLERRPATEGERRLGVGVAS